MAFKTIRVIRLNDQVSMLDLDAIGISDVAGMNIDSASEGDFLVQRCGAWVHESVPGAISSTVNNLSSVVDVGALTLSAGDILVWDGLTWSATALSYPSSTVNNISSIGNVNPHNILSAGDILIWNGTSWSATAAPTGGTATVTNISSIGNVNPHNVLSAGDILVWDGASWSSTSITSVSATVEQISSIGNVSINIVSENDILIWKTSSTAWVAMSNPGGSATVTDLSSVVDVVIAAASGGDVLTWNDSANVWTNRAASATAPLVMYVSHEYNKYGHENQAYDAPLGVFYNLGPLVVINRTGDLVYT